MAVLSGLELLGWVGGGMGAIAYLMVSTRRIEADGILFQGMNMVGCGLLCLGAFQSGAFPNAVMNLAWIGFGVHALIGANRRQVHTAAKSDLPAIDPDVVALAA